MEERSNFAVVVSSLADLGYCVAWRVFDAQYDGLAQRRERVFIVGSLRGPGAFEVLFEPDSLPGDPPPSREAGTGVAHALAFSTTQNHYDASQQTYIVSPDGSGKASGISPTLDARVQDGPRRNQGGMIVAHALTGRYDSSEDGTGRGVPLVVAPTLRTNCRNNSNPTTEARMLVIQDGGRAANKGQNGLGITEDGPCYTLDGVSQHAIAFTERTRAEGRTLEAQSELAYALTNPGAGGRSHSRQIAGDFGVRRLMPVECARLQGFPDDWCRLDAKTPDSPQYKAYGNAVWPDRPEWIGKRLMEAINRG